MIKKNATIVILTWCLCDLVLNNISYGLCANWSNGMSQQANRMIYAKIQTEGCIEIKFNEKVTLYSSPYFIYRI